MKEMHHLCKMLQKTPKGLIVKADGGVVIVRRVLRARPAFSFSVFGGVFIHSL
jgi:hypothetical protein